MCMLHVSSILSHAYSETHTLFIKCTSLGTYYPLKRGSATEHLDLDHIKCTAYAEWFVVHIWKSIMSQAKLK